MHLTARAHSSRHNQNFRLWTSADRISRIDAHAIARDYSSRFFSDSENLERLLFPRSSRNREDLEWTCKIEDFNLVEDQNRYLSRFVHHVFHSASPSSHN